MSGPNDYRETKQPDGSKHQTWWDQNERFSQDVDPNGNISGRHFSHNDKRSSNPYGVDDLFNTIDSIFISNPWD